MNQFLYKSFTLAAMVSVVVLTYPLQASASVIVNVTERPLYVAAGNQFEPRISGDRVVFTDMGSGFADIFVGDVITGVFDNVTDSYSSNEMLNDVDGDLVVYSAINDYSVVVIDGDSPFTVQLTIPGTSAYPNARPRIQGNHIVYERFNGIDRDIWVREVTGDGNWLLTMNSFGEPAPGNQQDPVVSEGNVVFTEDSESIWWCDAGLTTSCTYIDEGLDPDIDGNRVVYGKEVGDGNYDVFLYTIDGLDPPINVTKRAGNQVRPTIAGNYIAYDDDSAGNWDVYLYLIDVALTTQLTSNPADQKLSHVGDGHVVYEDDRDEAITGVDIYATDFTVEAGVLSCEPSAVNFGDVALGESSDQIVTCTDTQGGRYLDGIVVDGYPENGFSATTDVGLPYQFPGDDTVDITVSFMPTVEAWYSDFLVINGRDELPAGHTAYWYEIVSLQGNGVIVEPPPGERIQSILEFFDAKWASGELIGHGPGKSADNRAHALRNMIEAAGDHLASGDTTAACEQLMDAYRRTDGAKPPPDFVAGVAAAELATLIYELWTDLGCMP